MTKIILAGGLEVQIKDYQGEFITRTPRSDWLYAPEIGHYIHPRHQEVYVHIIEELSDPRFHNRGHGRLRARDAGCNGPLCRKALRDWSRAYTDTKHAMAGTSKRTRRRPQLLQEIDPLLEAFIERENLTKPNRVKTSKES